MGIVSIIDLVAGLLQSFLNNGKSQLPAEVVAAVQSAVDALFKHKQDLITKAALEANRG